MKSSTPPKITNLSSQDNHLVVEVEFTINMDTLKQYGRYLDDNVSFDFGDTKVLLRPVMVTKEQAEKDFDDKGGFTIK